MMIWVPVAVVVIGVIALALLSGMPYGRHDQLQRRTQPQSEVVTEGNGAPVSSPAPLVVPTTTSMPPPTHSVAEDSGAPSKALKQPTEITEAEAMTTLRNYIVSRQDYGISSDCLVISSQGYRNAGYTMQALDRCGENSFGQWRVDSKTREIFRRQSDGRYLRP